MKDVYTITRWSNGWAVDVQTVDGLKNYSGVFQDEDYEDDNYSQVESLGRALLETFDQYVATDETCGISLEVEDAPEEETEEIEAEGEEDDTG